MCFAEHGKLWISGFYLVTFALWVYAGVALEHHIAYLIVLALIGAHLIWQMTVFNLARPDRNFMLFRSNMTVGVMRSEENTSELKSLMRISLDVHRFNKKNH